MTCRKLFLIAALCASSTAFAEAPPAAKACETCHGSNGVATTRGVPHLNGQLPEYFVDSMSKFKAGKRPSSAPAHASPALTPEAVKALAAYYSAQKAQRPAQQVDPVKVAKGAAVYGQRCQECHLDDGRGSDHEAPFMAGQSLEYLQAETTAYVSGKRKFPFMMDEAYQGLSKDDLEGLSHYFASKQQ